MKHFTIALIALLTVGFTLWLSTSQAEASASYMPLVFASVLPTPTPTPAPQIPLRDGKYYYNQYDYHGAFMFVEVKDRIAFVAGFLNDLDAPFDSCKTVVGYFTESVPFYGNSIHFDEYFSDGDLQSTMECEILADNQLSCVGHQHYMPDNCTNIDPSLRFVRGTLERQDDSVSAASGTQGVPARSIQEAKIKQLDEMRHAPPIPN